jgi:hypothetical protein
MNIDDYSDKSKGSVMFFDNGEIETSALKFSFYMEDNWELSKYGQSIMDQITNEFIGHLVDNYGKIVNVGVTGSVIGNKLSCFLWLSK